MKNNHKVDLESASPPKEQLRSYPRHWLVAFLLSFSFPGLGQLYNGQLKKAIALYVFLLLLTPVLFGVTKLSTYFYGYVTMLAIMLATWIYGISDAAVQASRKKRYVLKKYNRWYAYVLAAVLMIIVPWLFKKTPLSGMRHLAVVSPSQLPTMRLGDIVLADMHAYRKIEPDYGDLVIFDRPGAGIWTFRVAGLPGDTIQVVDDILIVNGMTSKLSYIRNVIVDGKMVHEYEEEMINGHKYRIYASQKAGNKDNPSPEKTVVPDNNYFLLGDNRGNALDSRYIGFVPTSNIRGRILFSIWGRSIDRFNVDFRNK